MMNLQEIEDKADELAEKMLATEHRQERTHHMWALEGLQRLAQIKAIVAQRTDWIEHTAMRQAEIDAMHKAANAAESAVGQRTVQIPDVQEPGTRLCTAVWFPEFGARQWCARKAGHQGEHVDKDGNSDRVWLTLRPAGEPDPTKPVADRLYELVSYLVQQSNEEHGRADRMTENWKAVKYMAASKAYDDAATKLSEILNEGGI